MYMYIITSLHFSIRKTEFEIPERLTVDQSGNEVFVIITKWKFEVNGSYEA